MEIKMILFAIHLAALLLCAPILNANSDTLRDRGCANARSYSTKSVVPSLCYHGKIYKIDYVKSSGKVILFSGQAKSTLHRIPKGFDPTLVGADVFIGFLPEQLQAYQKSGILLYVTSIRTSNSEGGGQCGSGAELSLQFLDVSARRLKIRQGILIGSCEKTIEILNQNISKGILGALSVVEGRLTFQFMNYENKPGFPIATVAEDFRGLRFAQEL